VGIPWTVSPRGGSLEGIPWRGYSGESTLARIPWTGSPRGGSLQGSPWGGPPGGLLGGVP
jgi:hypothetical protein